MEDTIFARLPFDPIILFIIMLGLIVILFVMLISTMSQLSRLIVKYKSFMKGRDGATLDRAFEERFAELEQVLDYMKQHEKDITQLKGSLQSQFQKIGIVKYDAFQEMGAKLSFVLTLLDEQNNGFVLNSIHSREGCYTYIKEIIKGESFIPLSEEEVNSLAKAINSDNYLDVE